MPKKEPHLKLVTSQEEKKLADALKSDIPPLPDPDDPHWADAQGDSDPPPGGKPKKPKEEPAGWALDEGKCFETKSSDTLRHCSAELNLACEWRYNLRSEELERRLPFETVDCWLRADEKFLSELAEEIERTYWYAPKSQAKEPSPPRPLKFSDADIKRSALALSYQSPIDPFEQWLEALPPWNGVSCIDGLLTAVFGCDDTPINRWASRFLLLGAVQRTFEPGGLLRAMPILIGDQGIGKSQFLAHLLPDDKWFTDVYNLHEKNTGRRIEATLGKVIVEISEMAGIRGALLEQVKADISRRVDRHRLAYRKDPQDIPRRFIFVGTSNDASVLPNDPSGNARFVPVVCKHGCEIEKVMPQLRDQLWAEALAQYKAGARAKLPHNLAQAHAELAEAHRDRDDALEQRGPEAIARIEHRDEFPTMAAILSELDLPLGNRMIELAVGRALRNAGYVKERHMNEGKRLYWWVRG